jgi:hypothetical protein
MASLKRCKYELTRKGADGINSYRCIGCGDERKSKYPAHQLHRWCGDRPGWRTKRERIEEDIATDITSQTRTMAQINQTLDKCFSGCKHMKRWCTKHGNRQLQEQYQAWIEYLLEDDCTPE